MEKDLDKQLYNDYLNGKQEAFETLYNKYKSKIEYFIYNIVKDYSKAEDLTQETFIYIMKNKMKNEYSFKYHIYLVAKSKAFNYINVEKRRNEIGDLHNETKSTEVQRDVLDLVTENESKREILESIELLDKKYKNAIYLVVIEGMSYEETANILNESISNTKNLIHRGKKQLKTILTKKGFNEMKKSSKVIILVICISLVLIGGVYATLKIIEKVQGQAQLTPTFTQSIGDNDINSIWVGSFQIAWNEFMDTRVKESVEFEDGESELAKELNKRMFTKDMLSPEDYYIKIGETSNKLKSEIESDIKEKFGIENSSALDQINFDVGEKSKSYTIYAVLYKNFKFLTHFDRLYTRPFNGSEEVVRYFGINNASSEDLNKNVEVLFYNDKTDFAVSLKTIENEDVILYCNDSNSSFNDLYNEVKLKANEYKGNRNFKENDLLTVPYININTIINYGELCGRDIKGADGLHITNAIQNVKFSLDGTGGNLVSEAGIKDEYKSSKRYFCFDRPFVLFLKESDKDIPYFALKVDNTDVLVKSSKEENKQILN